MSLRKGIVLEGILDGYIAGDDLNRRLRGNKARRTMLALYKTQKGEGFLELREAPIPKIEAHEVLVEVKAAGVRH